MKCSTKRFSPKEEKLEFSNLSKKFSPKEKMKICQFRLSPKEEKLKIYIIEELQKEKRNIKNYPKELKIYKLKFSNIYKRIFSKRKKKQNFQLSKN